VLTLGTMLLLNVRMTSQSCHSFLFFCWAGSTSATDSEDDSDTVQNSRIAWSSFLQEHLSSILAIQLLRQERRQERTAFHLLGVTVPGT